MEKTTDYRTLVCQIEALMEGVPYAIANLANVSAALWEAMPDINWVGFYKMHEGALVLYPFQGKPACIQIPLNRGVCGAAVREDRVQLVEDVHRFPGHIACDCASNSEIVLPIHVGGRIWGVLDIDSPSLGRFTREDQEGLQKILEKLEGMLAEEFAY